MYPMPPPSNWSDFGFKFHACYNPSMMAYELRVIENIPGGPNKTLRAEVSWVDINEGRSEILPPTFSFGQRKHGNPLQELMDSLWDTGIRPSSDRVIDNSPILDAKDAHLSDLRKIVFHELGVDK